MKKNKILIFRLILALVFWIIIFFPCLFIPRRLQYKIFWPIFTKLFLFAAKVKVNYIGNYNVKKSKNIIYAVNHRSFTDSFIIASLLRTPFTIIFISWMAKNKVFKFLTDKMGLISMHKTDLIEQKKSLDEIFKILNKDYSMIYFPEGGFFFNKPISKLKKGIVKIAKESQCYVVPLVIFGAGKHHDFLYDNKCNWKKIYVDSGTPMKYSDFQDNEKFLIELSNAMQKLYIKLEDNFN